VFQYNGSLRIVLYKVGLASLRLIALLFGSAGTHVSFGSYEPALCEQTGELLDSLCIRSLRSPLSSGMLLSVAHVDNTLRLAWLGILGI
jgi:hypothetical protein